MRVKFLKKIKDMRQREMKLKKREDDIKLKEFKIKKYEQNGIRFENKIEAFEFRNKELENTILLYNKNLNLQTRLNMLESSLPKLNLSDSAQDCYSLNVPQSSAKVSEISHIDQLIKGIHDRVSAYVLLKVEKNRLKD